MNNIRFILAVVLLVCGVAFAYPSVRANHPPDEPLARSFMDILPPELLKQLQEDCLLVTQHEKSQAALKNNKYRTRWLPNGKTPSTSMELAIEYLRKIVKPGKDIVGAEWWIQHVPAGPRGSIIWHVDKDESIASNKHYLSHPHTASILYLTDIGGPTVITDQWSPQGMGYDPVVAREGVISYPATNKYTVFQGELLHGVMPGRDSDTGFRMTFLVNWWTYKPEEPNCSELDYSLVQGLKVMTADEVSQFTNTFTVPANSPNYRRNSADLDSFDPVSSPANVLLLASPNTSLIDLVSAAKGSIANNSPLKIPTPSFTPSYIYTYSLPGGSSDKFRAPRKWFNGETLRMVWDSRIAEKVSFREADRIQPYIQRMQSLKSGSGEAGNASKATPVDHEDKLTSIEMRQQRKLRDEAILLKSEL